MRHPDLADFLNRHISAFHYLELEFRLLYLRKQFARLQNLVFWRVGFFQSVLLDELLPFGNILPPVGFAFGRTFHLAPTGYCFAVNAKNIG